MIDMWCFHQYKPGCNKQMIQISKWFCIFVPRNTHYSCVKTACRVLLMILLLKWDCTSQQKCVRVSSGLNRIWHVENLVLDKCEMKYLACLFRDSMMYHHMAHKCTKWDTSIFINDESYFYLDYNNFMLFKYNIDCFVECYTVRMPSLYRVNLKDSLGFK